MRITFLLVALSVSLAACGSSPTNTTSSNASNAANSSPAAQTLTVVDTPQRIKDMMATRGEQDTAAPTIKIVEPAANATVNSSTVKVKLDLGGDLKGYKPHKDPQTQMGNHIHIILDNQPYEAYYELGQPFELRNVSEGRHTIRVFASRPWHESYKNEGSFQMVTFTVKGGGDASKPTTTATGQTMAVNSNAANSNANRTASPAASPSGSPAATTAEGKDMQPSTAGAVDRAKPLLTYSR